MSVARRTGEDTLRRSHTLNYDSEETLESGSGNSRPAIADDSDAEDSHDARPENTDALRIHDELVAYVHALSEHAQAHTSVVIEHSYAKARECTAAAKSECGAAGDYRTLLVRGAEPCADCYPAPGSDDRVDVDTPDVRPELPALLDESEQSEEDLDEDEEPVEWEDKILALAPTSAHLNIATVTLEVLHSLRLAHLSSSAASVRADATKSHARRLRRALAPFWEAGGPPQQRPAAWLHGVLTAYLPRVFRCLYERLLSELRRSIPQLCEGLLAGRLPAPARGFLKGSDEAGVQPSVSRPLLVWLPSGRERLDARWEQRLRVLLPVHRVHAPPMERCGVEAWCAGVAGAARAALHSLDVPRAMLALGGVGAGAALALQLSSVPVGGSADGDNARALVLLAPPVLTAEGPRDTPDDPLTETQHPLLLVVGQNGMQCNASVASTIIERRRATGRRSRLVVAGAADDLLRMTTRARRHLRVPQQALDAAIAEECVRWICEVAGGEGAPPAKRPKSLSPVPLVSIAPVVTANIAHNENQISKERDTVDIVQLPVIQRAAPVTIRAGSDSTPHQDSGPGCNTVVRCVRAGIVARGRGNTPLALLPPRRRGRPAAASATSAPTTPSAASVAASELDILDLPIVFADDHGEVPTRLEDIRPTPTINIVSTSTIVSAPSSAHVTITPQREHKFSKVIVAKRTTPAAAPGPGIGSVRPIVVRSGSSVRLVKRTST